MGNTKKFYTEYKKTINRILTDLYGNTPYWGKGSQVPRIVKPINHKDDPKWSNFNFINTHYIGVRSVFWSIVFPKLKELVGGQLGNPELDKSWRESNTNMQILIGLWDNRHKMFTPDSSIANEMVDRINWSRKRGREHESYLQKALETLPFITDIVDVAGAGSTEDFLGTDIEFKYNGEHLTGQVKSMVSISEEDDDFKIRSMMNRQYTQDLLIFVRKDGKKVKAVVFRNPKSKMVEIESNLFLIPKTFLLFKVDYDVEKDESFYSKNELNETLSRFKKLI